MKKLAPPASVHKRIEGVRLYRDDVEYLMELFHKEVAPTALSDDDFEYESLDEFVERKGTRPNRLKIEAKDGEQWTRRIDVTFEGGSVWLYAYRDAPFHEVKDFLLGKRQWTYRVLSPWLWMPVAFVAGNIAGTAANTATKSGQPTPEWALSLIVIPLVMTAIGFLHRRFDFGLRLVRKHEGGFWKRNAEKIAHMLIGACVTIAVAWLGKKLGL